MRDIGSRILMGGAICLVVWAATTRTVCAGISADAYKLTIYQTKYYVMHTDLPVPEAREAAIRMTRMAEEYHERTKAFSGTKRQLTAGLIRPTRTSPRSPSITRKEW